MIIRKPTKIDLKPEDDFEEYENFKEEQQQQLSKLSRAAEHQSQFGGEDFALHGNPNRLFARNFQHPQWPTNDRSFDQFHPTFQSSFQNNLNFRLVQQGGMGAPGGFGVSAQSAFDRLQATTSSQIGGGGDGSSSSGVHIDGGHLNQLFSAMMEGTGISSLRAPAAQGTNPNPQNSLNNSH